jgi:hypothetical protein
MLTSLSLMFLMSIDAANSGWGGSLILTGGFFFDSFSATSRASLNSLRFVSSVAVHDVIWRSWRRLDK